MSTGYYKKKGWKKRLMKGIKIFPKRDTVKNVVRNADISSSFYFIKY